MCVPSIFCHFETGGGIPGKNLDFVVVILRGTARVKLEVEVARSRKGDSLCKLVVVPDRMDGLYGTPSGPGRRHSDIARVT